MLLVTRLDYAGILSSPTRIRTWVEAPRRLQDWPLPHGTARSGTARSLVSVARSGHFPRAPNGERKHMDERTDAYLPGTRWVRCMYVGRFLVVGPDTAAYRVSSRSFPNRKVVERDGALTVVPTADAADTENPYISYNCVRVVNGGGNDADSPTVAIGNGTHVDAVAEKLDLGYPARDALALSLLAYDFEKDDYDTPRIAGVVGETSFVGIVRRDGLVVEQVCEPTLIATYEKSSPEGIGIELEDAEAAARMVYDLDFEHPVCAAGVTRTPQGIETAIRNGND